ncbi:hypothetical protein D3C73_1261760 [compost metagenome]
MYLGNVCVWARIPPGITSRLFLKFLPACPFSTHLIAISSMPLAFGATLKIRLDKGTHTAVWRPCVDARASPSSITLSTFGLRFRPASIAMRFRYECGISCLRRGSRAPPAQNPVIPESRRDSRPARVHGRNTGRPGGADFLHRKTAAAGPDSCRAGRQRHQGSL